MRKCNRTGVEYAVLAALLALCTGLCIGTGIAAAHKRADSAVRSANHYLSATFATTAIAYTVPYGLVADTLAAQALPALDSQNYSFVQSLLSDCLRFNPLVHTLRIVNNSGSIISLASNATLVGPSLLTAKQMGSYTLEIHVCASSLLQLMIAEISQHNLTGGVIIFSANSLSLRATGDEFSDLDIGIPVLPVAVQEAIFGSFGKYVWVTVPCGASTLTVFVKTQATLKDGLAPLCISLGVLSGCYLAVFVAWILFQRSARILSLKSTTSFLSDLVVHIAAMDLSDASPANRRVLFEQQFSTIVRTLSLFKPYLPDVLFRSASDQDSEDEHHVLNESVEDPVTDPLAPGMTGISPKLNRRHKRSSITYAAAPRLPGTNVTAVIGLTTRDVSLLSVSLASFSKLCAQHDTSRVVAMHAEYVATIEQAIRLNGGKLHPLMADCIIASFNAALPISNGGIHACRAGVASHIASLKLAAEWEKREMPHLDARIVICSGAAQVGTLGSEAVRTFGVVGPITNRMMIIDSLSKELELQLVVDSNTQRTAATVFVFRVADVIAVEGQENEWVYELLPSNPSFAAVQHYNHIFEWLVVGEHSKAADAMRVWLRNNKSAQSDRMVRRLIRLIAIYTNSKIPYLNHWTWFSDCFVEDPNKGNAGAHRQRVLLHYSGHDNEEVSRGRIPSIVARTVRLTVQSDAGDSIEIDEALTDRSEVALDEYDQFTIELIAKERNLALRRHWIQQLVRRLPSNPAMHPERMAVTSARRLPTPPPNIAAVLTPGVLNDHAPRLDAKMSVYSMSSAASMMSDLRLVPGAALWRDGPESQELRMKVFRNILETAGDLISEQRQDTLIALIMNRAKALVQCDRCSLFLVDAVRQQLWFMLDGKKITIPINTGIAGHVALTGEVLNIPNAYEDPRFNPRVDKETGYVTKTILAIPCYTRTGEPKAVVQMINKQRDMIFTADDVQLSLAFGQLAVLALDHVGEFQKRDDLALNLNAILQTITHYVLTIDMEGKLTTSNHDPHSIFGRTIDEMKVTSYAEWFTNSLFRGYSSLRNSHSIEVDVNNLQFVDHLAICLATGQEHTTHDYDWWPAEAVEPLSVNYTVLPLNGADAKQTGVVVILENISKEKKLRSTMARYMSPTVVEKVLSDGGQSLSGVNQTATVVFTDIRSFTSISEALAPSAVVALLNQHFDNMVRAITENHGVLDKYIGDATMSVHGVPYATKDDAGNACLAALAMVSYTQEMNRERSKQGQAPIKIGIGINTGNVVSGNVGCTKRMEYTVIGDNVNLASRLESATKYYGVWIIISEFTYEAVQHISSFVTRELDQIRVVGKTQPIRLYELIAEEISAETQEMLTLYAHGYENYQQGEWDLAEGYFRQALAMGDKKATVRPTTTVERRLGHDGKVALLFNC
eukprot:TRINITY_DN11682_c0_g1_i1.p1 TRINITY_DN11682_c0_g1~~TRINITY_DN11682_c0_g1_i1.p1  ORF type:complete len:1419 (-),score=191.76 TRINITY_DN11682_c0_g1_i1:6-4226(-)